MRQYQDLERPYCFIGKEPLTPDEIGDGWDCCQDCINERLEKITIKEREDGNYSKEYGIRNKV